MNQAFFLGYVMMHITIQALKMKSRKKVLFNIPNTDRNLVVVQL